VSIQTGFLVVLFIGAANKDAILRDTPDPKEAMASAVLKTAEVMGPEWRPAGEWDEAITNVLGWSS
jgi:hypothetical protein